MKQRVISFLLCLVMVVSLMPTVPFEGIAVNRSSTILTAYSVDTIKIDGSVKGYVKDGNSIAVMDDGWKMYPIDGRNHIGAQWQKKFLYLALPVDATALTVNGKSVALSEPVAAGQVVPVEIAQGDYYELCISLADLGMRKPPVGKKIPITVSYAGGNFSSTLQLSDIDWFAVESPETELTAYTYGRASLEKDPNTGASLFDDKLGVTKINGGYHFKAPAYDDAAAGFANIRTYLQYTKGMFSELADHDQALYTEFDFSSKTMPEYTISESKKIAELGKLYSGAKLYPGYGFNISLADAYEDPDNGNYHSNIIRTTIVNTENGLRLLVLNGNEQYTEVNLDRYVGSTFRLGLRWEVDNRLIITVDGEYVATVFEAAVRYHWFMQQAIVFNAVRWNSTDEGDYDVSVTNLSVAKCPDPYSLPTVIAPGNTSTEYSEAITVDGKLNEKNWNLNNIILDDDGIEVGKFGSLWSDDAVYMAVDAGKHEKVALKVGTEELTIDMKEGKATGSIPATVKVVGNIAEISVVHRALDILCAEPGVAFDVLVQLGDAVFSGGIYFAGVKEDFLTDIQTQVGAPSSEGMDNVDNNGWDRNGQSLEKIDGGYRFKDLHAGGVGLKGSGRSYVYWQKNNAFAPLLDTSVGIYSEFEFCAIDMPVWTDAIPKKKMNNASANEVYSGRGFAWLVGGKADENGSYEFTSMNIYNTDDGLRLAVKRADGTYSLVDLNQKIGDKFRIGTMCYADGSMDVYVNGMLLTKAPIKNARRTLDSTTNTHIVEGGIALNLIQRQYQDSKNYLTENEDIIVEVTNIKMAKEVPFEIKGKPTTSAVVEVSYTKENPVIDGKLDEGNWYMSTNVGNTGKFAAKWDTKKLYLALDTKGASTSLTINDKEIPLTNAVTGKYTEIAVAFADLGVKISDYGTKFPITVTIGDDTFSGWLKLVGVDWILAESETNPVTLKARTTGTMLGTEKIDGGYRLFNLYDPAGVNLANEYAYMVYRTTEEPKWSLLDNQEEGTWLSFDVCVDSMPEYIAAQPAKHYAAYGLSLTLTDAVRNISDHNMVCLGIHNTSYGLSLVVLRNVGNPLSFPLNRYEGDNFHLSIIWKYNKDLVVYCDGEQVAYVEKAEIATGGITSDPSALFHMRRNENVAESEEDDFDVSITNVAAGNVKNLSLMDLVSWDNIRGKNSTRNSIYSDLVLPKTVSDGILSTNITWTSSNEDFLTSEGKLVTTPESMGELVTLTGTAENGDTVVYELILPGTGTEAGDTLVVEDDRNPATGVAKPIVTHNFILDTTNNSVVLDMKIKKDISVVELRDIDNSARIREDTLTLWVSDDNVTYTQVEDFKLMQRGNTWYLYDFAAEGRYVKVHSTHFEGTDAQFVRPLEGMLDAYNDALLGNGFKVSSKTVTNNTGKERYDYAYTIEGIEAQRVLLNGEMLYHYVENGNTIVRIPYLAAGATVTVSVLTDGTDVVNTENKECVYEVVYGTREAWIVLDARWIQTLNDGTMISIFSDDNRKKKLSISYSYDDGRTWTGKKVLDVCENWIDVGGAFVYDYITGRVFFYGMNKYEGDTGNLHFIASDDNGKTWYRAGKLKGDEERKYNVSYAQGLVLSTYDGDGPNVDMVFSTASRFDDTTQVFCIVGVYTKDAGNTWHLSEDLVTVDKTTGKKEGGTSEGCVMEREDGVLVMYSRNQDDFSENFVMAYSYDYGITWTPSNPDPAKVSTVYTTNTQPQFYRYNGADLLTWAGNTVMGGSSYIRTPLTVGVTYDGGENFRNLQDLYMAYCMQGLSFTTQHCCINQNQVKAGDDTFVICFWDQTNNRKDENDVIIRIDNFTDYFYRTKGAFDSFEHGNIKYEGWDTAAGITGVTNEIEATDGEYVMMLKSAYATRSVPYIQDGKIIMNLYVSDGAHLSVNMQCAYSDKEAKCAPLGFSADNYEVTFLGADAASGLKLVDGWNTIEIDLSLAASGTASMSVNGKSAAMPVNKEIGDYVSFVSVYSVSTTYIDEFCVIDDEDAVIPAAETVITAEDVELGEVIYGENEQIQTVKVTDGLSYHVMGNKATEPGTYELIVKGTGHCTGEVKLTWTNGNGQTETQPGATGPSGSTEPGQTNVATTIVIVVAACLAVAGAAVAVYFFVIKKKKQ